MAKVTIIGATGNIGAFAAHTISEIPYVSELTVAEIRAALGRCAEPGTR